jgi:ABC-type transport system substrate-binding protein
VWQTGESLTAKDVANNYFPEVITGSLLNQRLNSASITGIQIHNDYSFTLQSSYYDHDILSQLSGATNKLIDPLNLENHSNDNTIITRFPGSGPWSFSSITSDSQVTMTKNAFYHEKILPLVNQITINYIENLSESKIIALIQSGTADIASNYSLSSDMLVNNDSDYQVIQSHGYGGPTILLNSSLSPLDKLDFRKFILKSLDPWLNNKKSGFLNSKIGIGLPLTQPDLQINQTEIRSLYFADPVSSQTYLKEAIDSHILNIGVQDTGDSYSDIMKLTIQDLKNANFNINIIPLSENSYKKELTNKQSTYHILMGVIPSTNTLNEYTLSLIHQKGSINFINHNDSYLNELIEEQSKEPNQLIRTSKLREIQNNVLDNAYMYNSLNLQTSWFHSNNVKNFFPTDVSNEYFFWSTVWVDN